MSKWDADIRAIVKGLELEDKIERIITFGFAKGGCCKVGLFGGIDANTVALRIDEDVCVDKNVLITKIIGCDKKSYHEDHGEHGEKKRRMLG
jgi:hypothetical protein